MAKKVTQTFQADLWKNTNKGGAWQLEICVGDAELVKIVGFINPWSNASAAKRWAKEQAIELTGRKSIKWSINENLSLDEKGKPTYYKAEFAFKVVDA